MISYIGLFFIIWTIFGIIWMMAYDVKSEIEILYLQYTKTTIFLGGPAWWIICIIDFINFKKNYLKNLLRPRERKIK